MSVKLWKVFCGIADASVLCADLRCTLSEKAGLVLVHIVLRGRETEAGDLKHSVNKYM